MKREISVCSVTNFAGMSNICSREICTVRNGVTIVLEIADSTVTVMNIRHITKCSSPFFARFRNNFDSADKSDSDSSFPMMKFRGLVSS